MTQIVLFGSYGLTTVLLWIGVAFKIRDVRAQPTNRSLRALLRMMVSLGCVLPMVLLGPWADTWHGIEGLTSTVWHALALWAGVEFSAFLIWSSYSFEQARPRVQARVLTWMVTAGMILVAYLAADDPDRAHGFRIADFGWQSAIWQLAFLIGMSLAMVDGAVLALRFARFAEPRALRIGLRIILLGSLSGMTFCAAKICTALVQISNLHLPIVPGGVMVLLASATILGFLVGSLYPAMDARIRAIPRWVARRQQHRALYPLWHALRREFPVYVVGRAPSSTVVDALWMRHLHWRYYRRIIECYDMFVHLRPWFSAQVDQQARAAAQAAGMSGEQVDVWAAAAVIERALQQHREEAPPTTEDVRLEYGSSGDDLDASADWLVRVQRARRAPTLLDGVHPEVSDAETAGADQIRA